MEDGAGPLPVSTARLVVTGADLASSLALIPTEAYPPVFSTSRMIALMELAAARALQPLLRPGELSVGVSVDIRHTAATPLGLEVVAEARHAPARDRRHRAPAAGRRETQRRLAS
jgi:fluoroacetyl-CoA thioesterase